MDVKTAFLNGDLEKEIYMQQPKVLLKKANKIKFADFESPYVAWNSFQGNSIFVSIIRLCWMILLWLMRIIVYIQKGPQISLLIVGNSNEYVNESNDGYHSISKWKIWVKLLIFLELRFQEIIQRNYYLYYKSHIWIRFLNDSKCSIINP